MPATARGAILRRIGCQEFLDQDRGEVSYACTGATRQRDLSHAQFGWKSKETRGSHAWTASIP